MSTATILAPSAARLKAMLRPIPRDAPVTMATFPFGITSLLSLGTTFRGTRRHRPPQPCPAADSAGKLSEGLEGCRILHVAGFDIFGDPFDKAGKDFAGANLDAAGHAELSHLQHR